jgi:hypothetical protein
MSNEAINGTFSTILPLVLWLLYQYFLFVALGRRISCIPIIDLLAGATLVLRDPDRVTNNVQLHLNLQPKYRLERQD